MTSLRTLVCHVRESNSIECIYEGKNCGQFERHLEAAKAVRARGKIADLMTPLEITSILLPFKWQYRSSGVRVGGRIMPAPERVPLLMEHWIISWRKYHHFLSHRPESFWGPWAASRAWFFHDWFLCIHPFEDGNGRTARLLLNSFRLRAGLPWLVVHESRKSEYYTKIREFEGSNFRTWYPARPTSL